MELSGAEIVKLVDAIERLNESVKKLDQIGSVKAKASIDARGTQVSVMCVVILLIICIFQSRDSNRMQEKYTRDIIEMQRRYDRMQDYLNVIYIQAPHLRPKDEEK